MKIGIDMTYVPLEPLRNGRLTEGVQIFLGELLKGFEELGVSSNIELLAFMPQAKYISKMFPQYKVYPVEFLPLKILQRVTGKHNAGQGFIRRSGIWEKLLEHRGYSCIWFPYAIPATTVSLNVPTVYTVHDLIMCHESASPEEQMAYAEMINSASKVVAISDYVKRDITNTFPDAQVDVVTIPNAVELNVKETEAITELADKRFILDINAFQERKNAITLLKAFAKIAGQVSEDLVFCGGWKNDGYYRKLEEFIATAGLKDRVHLFCAIPLAQRNWLLQNASLFVTPSLSEGFGRTPVEAAICKKPVISSVSDSLEEATLGLVHYYRNATDADELANKILEVLNNPETEEQLIWKAEKLKNEYAVTTVSRKYWDIFAKYI